ncbi:amino acid permease [Arthrobacter roseus]|uniref:amino acid permease n=1 Tax=Arthrobacter roseus TaxID=136274 RepID=UPI003376B59C|nr:AAT family amino acid transporter [Arthrobacter roseus]
MTTSSLNNPETTGVVESSPQSTNSGSMKPRQLIMMGLGSAIGAGLFLGAGVGVQAAGPAVLIAYLIAGTLIIIVMQALGEMAAANPNSGAFSVYCAKAMGTTAGATIGWLWWVQLVIVIAAEAVGAAGLLAGIWPVMPAGIMALIFMILFTAVNLLGVKNFGEFEFWFAILKVAAIVIFLGIGAALILGLLPDVPSPGFSNLFGGDGFAPAGIGGIAAGLLVVVFAFGGTEIVSVAAAETEDPSRSVRSAVRTVVWRIMVFYIGSVFVIVMVVPWTSDALSSPFAAVLSIASIPGADTAITLVAVVALLSALNANLYGASRMIFSLSERTEAPVFLSRRNRLNVPVAAVLASVVFGFMATGLELLFPEMVLPLLLNIVGSTCLVVWGSALISQIILRRRADRDGTELPMRMAAFPALSYLGVALLVGILTIGFLAETTRIQLLSTFVLVAVIAVLSRANARRRAGVSGRVTQ